MDQPQETYSRLPGRSIRLGARYSLWKGRDHLLKVTNTGYAEEYRRFYLKDIQSIGICLDSRRWIWNAIWSVLIAFIFLFTIPMNINSSDAWGFFLFLSSIPIIVILFNTLLGPTCECRIRTAVQEELLQPVGRVRSAKALLEIIRPMIRDAQADIPAPVEPAAPPEAPEVTAAAEPAAPPTETEAPRSDFAPQGES